MFRYKKSIPLSYERQGYIFFKSLCYRELPEKERREILALCKQAGGEYCGALLEFVTTDAGAAEVCAHHYLSKSTLYRMVRMYYKNFPMKL
ncbi:MAG: hypothetical protein HDT20_04345 [Oscillibacter sp.]|nr:hypothetical protein [Oscillibacter sp.]